ncbi:MAG TPA: FAD-binding protein, partial [Thermomicrobiales bacterium]|nr:FAD-binding protein [Thermomicrobiales bacterium]
MTQERAELIRALAAAAGDAHVVSDPAGLSVYQYDASDEAIAGIHQPIAAVLPATAEEVRDVAQVAIARGLPVVARGAGTGLAGGAIACRGGVMIVMTRMTGILEVNETDRYAIVEPGLINLDL